MKPLKKYSVEGGVRVLEHAAIKNSSSLRSLIAGSELGIETSLLEHYCFEVPNEFTHDLMTLVAAVRAADRQVRRIHSEGWSRLIHVDMPMFEAKRWEEERVRTALEDVLNFLTGDVWDFKFRQRRRKFSSTPQKCLSLTAGRKVTFIPYSHGLDSYAQLRILQNAIQDVEAVCVFADTKQMSGGWKKFCMAMRKKSVKAIRIPLKFNDPKHSERTFRTRPFIYYLLSAYGAWKAKSNDVLIPENGQGSLGGSLAQLGNEAPHRSCHPGFTTRLSKFFQALTGATIRFEHPALFRTKAEVFSDLKALEPETTRWLADHWSCSHDQRNSSHKERRIHCGVCGNCILRRCSAHAAGIADESMYKFSDLSVEFMKDGLLENTHLPKGMVAFEDLASNGIRSMQRLADMANDVESDAIWAEAGTLAISQNEDVHKVHKNLARFLRQHSNEWNAFLMHCGPASWVQTMAKGY